MKIGKEKPVPALRQESLKRFLFLFSEKGNKKKETP
jgi:hypothetical protein